MSLLFNTLCRCVIDFLLRSKYPLISWLQSPSAVILEWWASTLCAHYGEETTIHCVCSKVHRHLFPVFPSFPCTHLVGNHDETHSVQSGIPKKSGWFWSKWFHPQAAWVPSLGSSSWQHLFWVNLSKSNKHTYTCPLNLSYCFSPAFLVIASPLDSMLKSRDITLPTKVCLVKAMVFPVGMYGCESWIIKKVEHWRTDAFEPWYWRRLLRVPWTARRSKQSILKEVSLEYSLEGLMLKRKL